jgi:hypothetical protein
VGHAVAEAEENIIWEAANGIFRPVKSDTFKAAEEAAKKRGKDLPDPRAGHPTHRKPDRLTRGDQRDVAGELGYTPYQPRNGNPKEPIFYKADGDPRYISYDHTTHGAADRTGQLPPNVPWKGANDARTLENRGRDGTYVPKYDANGNVVFDRVRN